MPAKPKPSPQLTGPVQLDDETRNALILFNARLVAQDELDREKRRVDKAAKAKDEAAAKVRQLESNPKATAEEKSEAQAAYLASLDALNRAKAGEPAAGPEAADTETDETDENDGTDDTAGDPADDDAEPEPEPEAEAEAEPAAEPEPAAVAEEAAEAEPEPAAEAEPAADAEPEAPVAAEESEEPEPATNPES